MSPRLNERSLKQHQVANTGQKKQNEMFLSSMIISKETDKDLSSASSPISPLSLPLRPIVDKPLNTKYLFAQYVTKISKRSAPIFYFYFSHIYIYTCIKTSE